MAAEQTAKAAAQCKQEVTINRAAHGNKLGNKLGDFPADAAAAVPPSWLILADAAAAASVVVYEGFIAEREGKLKLGICVSALTKLAASLELQLGLGRGEKDINSQKMTLNSAKGANYL